MKNRLFITRLIGLLLILFFAFTCNNDDLYVELHDASLPNLGIKQLNVESVNEIEITFTHDILMGDVEAVSNYTLQKSDGSYTEVLSAQQYEQESNKIVITTDALDASTTYVLRIYNIRSIHTLAIPNSGLSHIFDTTDTLSETSAVTLYSPVNGEPVNDYPVFTWTTRTGATGYELQITSSTLADGYPDFSTSILSITTTASTYEFNSEDIENEPKQLDEIKYYWRVRAVYGSTNGPYSSYSYFNVLSNQSEYEVVYVWSGFVGESTGNKSTPFTLIQDAIDFANQKGRSTVVVAGGQYYENLVMKNGISVYGGYNPQTWSFEPSDYKTIIYPVQTEAVVLFGSNISQETVLDNVSIGDYQINFNNGIQCLYARNAVISNCTIEGINPIECKFSIVKIHGNILSSSGEDDDGNHYGIYSYESYVEILNNQISLQHGSNSKIGIYISGYNWEYQDNVTTIRDNFIGLGMDSSGGSLSAGIYIEDNYSQRFYITYNSIEAALSYTNSYGVYTNYCNTVVFKNRIFYNNKYAYAQGEKVCAIYSLFGNSIKSEIKYNELYLPGIKKKSGENNTRSIYGIYNEVNDISGEGKADVSKNDITLGELQGDNNEIVCGIYNEVMTQGSLVAIVRQNSIQIATDTSIVPNNNHMYYGIYNHYENSNSSNKFRGWVADNVITLMHSVPTNISDFGVYNQFIGDGDFLPHLFNNIISSEVYTEFLGIVNQVSFDPTPGGEYGPTIYNNSIRGNMGTSTGIVLNSNNGSAFNTRIANNIIMNVGYGLLEFTAASDPYSLNNNCIFNTPNGLYRDENTTNITNLSTSLSIKGGSYTLAALGHVSVNPELNPDLTPTPSTPTSVSEGGLDGENNDFIFVLDRDGTIRTGNGTTGWSMGAYEKD